MSKVTTRLTLQLGVTQTIGFASSYYLSAILAKPIAADLGFSFQNYFLFVAAASIVTAVLAPILGKQIDRFGGRIVLPASSIVFAIGLTLMSQAVNPLTFLLAWLVTAIGMASGLYEAAFATVVEVLGQQARRTIAGITLLAGFASTIGWPITSYINEQFSWREAILFWAITHVVIALPLHLLLPGYKKSDRRARRIERDDQKELQAKVQPVLVLLLAAMFIFGGVSQVAMGAHLPGVILSFGASSEFALFASTLLGPGQVAARLLQVAFSDFFTPVRVSWLALVLHPLGAAFLAFQGEFGFAVFALLHGMGSGFLTVAGGVLPLYMFGSQNYGQRQGWIMAASHIVLAFTPAAFSLVLVAFRSGSLAFTIAANLIATVILIFLIRSHRHTTMLAQ